MNIKFGIAIADYKPVEIKSNSLLFSSGTIILMAMFLTFFVGCSPRGQSSSNLLALPHQSPTSTSDARTASDSSTPQAPWSQGTADSGGGNTFLGKPLESYKINPRDLAAYQKIVRTIIESQTLVGSRIGNALLNILENKIWYLIPSELKKLSPGRIGAAVGSDQAALQDSKQIWLNSLIFEKMEISDQAVLIIHELLMGLRLLKFDSDQAECLAYLPTTSANDPQYCHKSGSDKPRGKPSDLKELDYAQIRSATALVVERKSELALKDWEDILGIQGFIDRPVNKQISLAELGEMLAATKLMKTWPAFGFDMGKFFSENQELVSNPKKLEGIHLSSDQTCEIEVMTDKDHFSISIIENGQKVFYGSKWTGAINLYLENDALAGFFLYSVGSPKLASSENFAKGDSIAYVKLKFLGNLLMGIDLSKTVCLNDGCTEDGQGLNGVNLSCYTKSSVSFGTGK